MVKSTPQQAGQVPVATTVRTSNSVIPDRLYMLAPEKDKSECRRMAMAAAAEALRLSPKLSGRAAAGIRPYFGQGFFGVKWDRPYLWYQESGTRAFTMRNLAGKVIPMWVDDWTGEQARKNPKAKTRITANGRRQILIFRKVGKIGARKKVAVRDSQGRLVRWRSAPQSYPGAPGRISNREWTPPDQTTGRITRLISRPHVGVRWRHPGLVPREFLQNALAKVGEENGLPSREVFAVYRRR